VGNLQELKISPDRGLVVAGDSTGGDMAMVIAHLYALQQPQSPPLTGLYLGCPVAMDKNIAPERYRDYYLSMEQNAKGPALTAESINFILCESHIYSRTRSCWLMASSRVQTRSYKSIVLSNPISGPLEATQDVSPGLRDGSTS
jgi:hypothetical protein